MSEDTSPYYILLRTLYLSVKSEAQAKPQEGFTGAYYYCSPQLLDRNPHDMVS